eukprot:CAMPEP_0198286518 /NCGR_PEP_ID=MMETSP1449-20131203/5588_1 /TAXON_ID=420275 /ORGANISM="Attheya septentrionalis, Strain CCMP2084" /LENGTH=1430 /DNA_ID=CAMNT_0043984289 /DNA_START=169 /DNA_END=4461 /DNA_ORIENTATION=-
MPANKKRRLTIDTERRFSDESASTATSTRSLDSANSSFTSKNAAEQNVRVVARLRPLSGKEISEKSNESIKASEASNTLVIDKNRTFEYDAVFPPKATNSEVYEKTAGDMVSDNIFKGFNVTILAYGQTGSGKTFTMGTEGSHSIEVKSATDGDTEQSTGNVGAYTLQEEDGIIPRAVYDLFQTRSEMKGGEERVQVEMSYLEIYNEEARDLLTSQPVGSDLLHIRDSKTEGVVVQNLSLHKVTNPSQVSELMNVASRKRATASTSMNAVSSRSHAICTLYVTIAPLMDSVEHNEDDNEVQEGINKAKLTLVDLAGSERIKRTGAEGARMKEGININKGLFVLGQVVSALSELSQQQGSSSVSAGSVSHVPYRDSKLTRLLQDSLGGNSKTVMVACVSPADTNVEESINTLRYAERTRNIKNSAVQNTVATSMSPAEAAALRRENQMLKLQLFQAQSKLSGTFAVPSRSSSGGMNSQSLSIQSSSNEDNSIEGEISINNLEIVTKLKAVCSSLRSKLESMESRVHAASDDALSASLRADKWQLKFETLVNSLRSQGLPVPNNDTFEEDVKLTDELRKEIADVRERLNAAVTDAEIARATAAAVVAGNGDLVSAEEFALAYSNIDEEESVDDSHTEESSNAKLAAELVSMSSGIDGKEILILQMNKERECMETMKSHFESAIGRLHEEMEVLSSERETLKSKITQSKNKSAMPGVGDVKQKDMMRERIGNLEQRIKDLKNKAAEHSRALRLREQAEKKCAQLASEILEDKKRRAALQRKLKESAQERRSEKKEAQLKASRMIRDSQKLKFELNKVKEAASKQAAVLRRKAAEAISKQKAIEEQHRKRNQASSIRTARIARSRETELGPERREELIGWIEQEANTSIALNETMSNIEQQKELLHDAEATKKGMSSSNSRVPSTEQKSQIRFLENEIEQRSRIIQQLEKNVKDIKASSTKFVDSPIFNSMSRAEVKVVMTNVFERLLTQMKATDKLNMESGNLITKAVNQAISKERKAHDETIYGLQIQHSESIAGLIESTTGAMEHTVRSNHMKNIDDDLNPMVKSNIDEMLNSFVQNCTQVGNTVKEELRGVKEKHDGMKQMVDDVLAGWVSQNEANTASEKKNSDKKKVLKKRKSVFPAELDLDELEDGVDDAGAVEDSDDSDWSPDSPGGRKKTAEDTKLLGEQIVNEALSSIDWLEKKKVAELREMLRDRGLPVSGKKSELIQRLVSTGIDLEDASNYDTQTKPLPSKKPLSSNDENKENRRVSRRLSTQMSKPEENGNINKRRLSVRNSRPSLSTSNRLSKEDVNTSSKNIDTVKTRPRKSAINGRVSTKAEATKTEEQKARKKRPLASISNTQLDDTTTRRKSLRGRQSIASPQKVQRASSRKSISRPAINTVVTASAKKRRRKSMAASINKAMMQLDALESLREN